MVVLAHDILYWIPMLHTVTKISLLKNKSMSQRKLKLSDDFYTWNWIQTSDHDLEDISLLYLCLSV